MTKILIYDDDEKTLEDFTSMLESVKVLKGLDKEPIPRKEFEKNLVLINNRREMIRNKSSVSYDSIFDDTDILILDFDLLKTFNSNFFLTAEHVAELLRCFTTCGLIIGMNHYGENYFDLTLKGHIESFCDLNIGEKHLSDPGLWSSEFLDFRPWYWPILLKSHNDNNQRIKDIEADPEQKVCETIGLSKVLNHLSNETTKYLGNKEVEEITFTDFVISSGNGLKTKKDRNIPPELISRIASSRISKWIERLILPNQDPIIDAPHLAVRYPSLFGLSDDIKTFQGLTDFSYDRFPKELEKYKYSCEHWVSRPVWYLTEIMREEGITENKEPWKKINLKYGFCEDASKFYPINDCKIFTPEIESSYSKRFIKRFDEPIYTPLKRLI